MQRATTKHIWQMVDDTGVKVELLAEYMGCNETYLRDLRRANVPMSGPMRQRFSQLFGIPEQELFMEYLRESEEIKRRK